MEMSWHSRDREAQLLAGLLRSSRLTLLTGVAGAGKTCLLREGVLPRLARRVDDPPGPLPSQPACDPLSTHAAVQNLPHGDLFPEDAALAAALEDDPAHWAERRREGGASAEPGTREVAVYMDAWSDEAPLAELRRRLFHAFGRACPELRQEQPAPPPLRDEIEALCREHDARVLVVLDAFEHFLGVPPAKPSAADFAREWARAVNQPGLPAHFLVAVRQEAQELLGRFHHELPALASNWVGLLPVPLAAAPAPPDSAAPGPVLADQESQAPEAALLAAPSQADPLPMQSAAAAPSHRLAVAPLPALAPRLRLGTAAGVCLVVLAGALAWWWSSAPKSPPQELAAAAAPTRAPAASTSTGPAPPARGEETRDDAKAPTLPASTGWAIQTGPGQRTDAQVAEELKRSLAGRLPAGSWPALQIVHYDALEAARTLPSPPWRVIGPLFPEELQVVVRADAPLSYIHQIRGRRIGTTLAADGAPSGTAALLHQRLFGQPPGGGQVLAAPWPQALADLQAGRTEVLVLADGEPSAWWSELSAEERRGLRLLALDPAAPQTRQAQQSFLPVRMRVPEGLAGGGTAASPGGRTVLTLAVMSFLTTTAPPEADAAVVGLVRAWCQAMPELRRTGHPKWRTAQPWLPLGVGGASVPGVREALSRCAPAPSPGQPARPPSANP